MALYFFDTSALVKRYAPEVGTSWVRSLTDPTAHHKIYIAEITGVETIAAIKKLERMGTKSGGISQADAANAIKQFRHDFAHQYKILEVNGTIISSAMDLTEHHKLRAYDAVQLAVALQINAQLKTLGMAIVGVSALTIVSADNELNTAATAEGLIVENPRNYP